MSFTQPNLDTAKPRSVLDRLLVALSYPRGVIVSLLGGLWTLFMSVVVLFLAGVIRDRRWVDVAIIYFWSLPLIRAGNVSVELRGQEHVTDSKKGFLILFNHSSHMDIPILYAYFPRTFRFGAKIELFKIPLFGKAMELCGVLPIDRNNRNKVMEVYRSAITRIENGESFALAPEGTRQSEPKIGRFKRGPFEFAISAQMDVVPVVLAGAYEVMPKKTLWINQGRWHRKVIMQITPRIPTQGYTPEQAEELQELVRARMEPLFNRMHAELEV